MLTPHIGGSTEEAQQNIGEDVSNKLFKYLEMGMTIGSHTYHLSASATGRHTSNFAYS